MLYFVGLLLLLGSFFVFLAALGLWRFPDLYTRCHASSKASTVGKVFPFLALVFYFSDLSVALKAGLVIFFFFLTVPVGTHLITRAGYVRGAKKWAKTQVDEYA